MTPEPIEALVERMWQRIEKPEDHWDLYYAREHMRQWQRMYDEVKTPSLDVPVPCSRCGGNHLRVDRCPERPSSGSLEGND